MANVSLKADFKDGDKLFAQQLNNNFNAIMAALSAMNKIVWQDDPDDTVVTFRGTTEEINSRDIIDGQLLYDTSTGETYIDYGSQRISTGSGNAIFIGEDEPTNPATQLWIDPTEMLNVIGSEIESGSNENGNWVKYSDGTMICTKVQELGRVETTTSFGNIYWSNDIHSWTYPQTFLEVPDYVNMSPFTTSIAGCCLQSTPTTTGATCFLYAFTSGTRETSIYWMAIGRWK